ncbi:MAG: tripartite tricarboxylate transporter TctB family protein [Pseudomonadota bacterium]
MMPNRDFITGLIVSAFFALTLFVLIPVYVKVPSFIPGFAPPPNMWPRVIAVTGLFMGLVALILSIPAMRQQSSDHISGLGAYLHRHRVMIVRFAILSVGFIAFVYALPVLGFLVSSTLLLGFLFLMTGNYSNRVWVLVLTALFPFLLYTIFAQIAHTRFPAGKLFSAAGLTSLF